MRRSLIFVISLTAALWSIAPASSIAAPPPPTDAVQLLDPPQALPAEDYVDAAGTAASLKAFAGKVVVLNFWATWCAPCVKELPSLDRLSGLLPPDRFKVLALSNDRGGAKQAAPFLAKLGLKHLAADLDPKSALTRALGLRVLPTTYVLDQEGMIVAKLEGMAEWDNPAFVDWLMAMAPPQ